MLSCVRFRTLELKDREMMSWYQDKVKQAIKEGKDLDSDRHFVNKGTQDLFKTYLTGETIFNPSISFPR